MSEAYIPPTSTGTAAQTTQGTWTNPGRAEQRTQYPPPEAPDAANVTYMDSSKPVQYLCGDCSAKVMLKRGDPIRCKECGHRVLYKERTNRMVQFEAR